MPNVNVTYSTPNSVEVATQTNTVTIVQPGRSSVTVNQTGTQTVEITAPGPQGPAGQISNTGSFATTGSNTFIGTQIVTGSIDITGSLTVNTINVGQNTINFIDENRNIINSLFIPSGSTNITINTGSIESTGEAFFSGSFTGSLFGTADTASYYAETDPIYNAEKGKYLTTGSFGIEQTIVGNLTINQNLTVLGSQSIQYITSSQLDISTNIIRVSTATPSIRFGGLAVYDSGSTGLTGSILWDSQHNVWIYTNPSGSVYDGAMILVGPRNNGGIGNEVGITQNHLSKGDGSHHMTSSQITDDGVTVNIPGNLIVDSGISSSFTGSLSGNASSADYATSAGNASTADNINGYSNATVNQINMGELNNGTYTYMVRSEELEQSKHSTINIFNFLNFT